MYFPRAATSGGWRPSLCSAYRVAGVSKCIQLHNVRFTY